MASAAVAKRRGSASATRAEAKARRQKITVAVLAVVLGALLVYEVPKTMKTIKTSSTPVAAPAPAAPASSPRTARVHGSGTGADPFVHKSLPKADPGAVADSRPDPFTSPHASHAAAPVTAPAALPQQFVIGRPGGHRVARHGWIVILASIPTRNGHGDAVSFARSARRNVGKLSILNSSNSRPLRGGYWVVYSGPYPSLGAVNARVGAIHAAGYRTAYIRRLISYR